MDEKVMKRSLAGAAFLDERLGRGWWRRIKLSRLDLESGYYDADECGCVLAQLDAYDHGTPGFFSRKRKELGLSASRADRLGFMMTNRIEKYPELTEAWKQIVRERRRGVRP